jgi:hypothetical protein
LLRSGDRAGRACSMTRSPRMSAERPGLRGSAARRLPRTPSAACQRAALHGPGHWHHAAPDEVPWIVRCWLRGYQQTPDELRADAVQVSAGRSKDSRPCSDARADKTDLHAYDGDCPKLSHRTERRLRTRPRRRNLRAPDSTGSHGQGVGPDRDPGTCPRQKRTRRSGALAVLPRHCAGPFCAARTALTPVLRREHATASWHGRRHGVPSGPQGQPGSRAIRRAPLCIRAE